MKRLILSTLLLSILIGLNGCNKDEDIITSYEEVKECTVTNTILNTQNEYLPIVTGTTSCDNTNLQFELSCNYSVTSIESGSSKNGIFEHIFTSAMDCRYPSVKVTIK